MIMSTTSYFAGEITDSTRTGSKATKAGGGVFTRVMAAIVAAREMQAKREAYRYLARQPDRLLRDIGLDQTEIASLRRQFDA